MVEQVAATTRPFRLELSEVTPFPDGSIYLNVKEGSDAIVQLRDRLYAGGLARHKSRSHTFVPHVTIGWAGDKHTMDRALSDAEALGIRIAVDVASIAVFRFDESGQPVEDFSVPLGA